MYNQKVVAVFMFVLMGAVSVLTGCGSEDSSNPGSGANASVDAGAIDARKTIHTGTLQSNTSGNSSTHYVIQGCYKIDSVTCPGADELADHLKSGNANGLCFQLDGNNYYLQTKSMKQPLTISSDGKTWETKSRSIDVVGYAQIDLAGEPVSSNSILDKMNVNLVYSNIDECEKVIMQVKCSFGMSFNSSMYENVSNKIYTEPKLSKTCDTSTSGTAPSTQLSVDSDVLQKWVTQTAGITTNLYAIAYGNGKYVAVGEGGAVLISSDAKSWTSVAKLNVTSLESIAFGNGKFVTGGWGSMFVSNDGVKWDLIKDAPLYVQKIIRSDSLFIAAGYYYNTTGIISSSDGLTWTPLQNGGDYFLTDIAKGDGVLVVVDNKGEILTSTDAVKWTLQKSPTTNAIYKIVCGNKMCMIPAGSGKYYFSNDNAATWTVNSNLPVAITSIFYSNGVFVGTGSQEVFYSTDGNKWTQITESIGGYLYDLLFDGSKYVGVGSNGYILTSQ